MFPLGPDRGPDPDIIGTRQPRVPWLSRVPWMCRVPALSRWIRAAGLLVLAGAAIAVLAVPSLTRHQAAPSATRSGSPAPDPSPPEPLVPPRAWAASLNVATWPVEQTSAGPSGDGVFALGAAGQHGWSLAVHAVTRPGQGCAAEVSLGGAGLAGAGAAALPARPANRTPAGDLAFIALGHGMRGIGIAFLRAAAPGGSVWANPHLVGELVISVPVVTVSACGRQYYLAGFAYPLQGALDLFATRASGRVAQYLVPERLTRPAAAGVWQTADGG